MVVCFLKDYENYGIKAKAGDEADVDTPIARALIAAGTVRRVDVIRKKKEKKVPKE